MAHAQDEAINSTNVKGQTSNNAFGAFDTTKTALDKEILKSITQHNKNLDFFLPNSNRLKGESNYQVWSFRMAKILERHRIWTLCVNPKIQGVVLEVEHENRKLALDVIFESVWDSLIPIIRRYIDPHKCWQHLKGWYEPNTGS